MRRRESDVALDPHAKGKPDAREFGQAERAEFGATEPQVGEAEQRVAIGVEFARQPCRRTERIEEFYDRNGVGFVGTKPDRIAMRGGVTFVSSPCRATP